ncbi:hypothetical protein M0R45_006383 [Rubus argutus]|uniref:Uncharacterized protein n=1 Tax=Rubus argutus TaxID=59490 RepID=A0AAW1YQY5_RUBAR
MEQVASWSVGVAAWARGPWAVSSLWFGRSEGLVEYAGLVKVKAARLVVHVTLVMEIKIDFRLTGWAHGVWVLWN